MAVAAIDWSSANNKIVSCSHDRNAFVWTFQPATADEPAYWKPGLVILRFERAAIDVRWANDGMRFACTSGAKYVSICTYEAQNDWYVERVELIIVSSYPICVIFAIGG